MLYRATAVLNHQDGLVKDAVTNTFWFEFPEDADPSVAKASAVALRVVNFYAAIPTGEGTSPWNLIATTGSW